MTQTKINLVSKGEPAQLLAEWKKRGLVSSCRDAVIQSFKAFQEKLVDRDLKAAQLKTLTKDVQS